MPGTHGFIKLSRSITACGWFKDNNTLAVLVRLTLLAEWQSTVNNGVELKRGQLITTIPQIAEINQLTVQQTRTILDRLKSTGRITDKPEKINRLTNSQSTDLPYYIKKIRSMKKLKDLRSRTQAAHSAIFFPKRFGNTTISAGALLRSQASLHISRDVLLSRLTGSFTA